MDFVWDGNKFLSKTWVSWITEFMHGCIYLCKFKLEKTKYVLGLGNNIHTTPANKILFFFFEKKEMREILWIFDSISSSNKSFLCTKSFSIMNSPILLFYSTGVKWNDWTKSTATNIITKIHQARQESKKERKSIRRESQMYLNHHHQPQSVSLYHNSVSFLDWTKVYLGSLFCQ